MTTNILIIIDSGDGLSPIQIQTVNCTSTDLLSYHTLGNKINEILLSIL